MIKLYCLMAVASALLLPMELKAQTKFGLKAGPNISKLSGDHLGDSQLRIAPMFGFFAGVPITETIYFQPEAIFSLQGSNFSFSSSSAFSSSGRSTAKLTYLNFPFLLKKYFGNEAYVVLGPQIGYLLYSREMGTVSNRKFDNNVNLKNKDIAIVLGFGIEISPNMNIGARYNYGLNNLYRGSVASRDRQVLFNRVFQIHTGYTFK